jgi:hypothetical protein
MNCLSIIQEAAVRVGIVQPSTIENVSSPDPSRKDPDAMILLGALNETMRQAVVKNLFDPFTVMAKIAADNVQKAGNTYIWPILTKCADFGGLLSSYFNVEFLDAAEPPSKKENSAPTATIANTETFFECDPDNFLKHWKDPGVTAPQPIPERNMFKLYNGSVYFIARQAFAANRFFGVIRFSYRSTYGVLPVGSTTPTSSFTKDTDTSNVDGELLIAGTVLNYKAYQGMDYQFDMQKYTDYLKALESNRRTNNLFRDNSLGRQGVAE